MRICMQFLFLFLAITGYAELQWDTTAIRRRVLLNETDVVSTINFKNIGNSPVKIIDIKIPCGCTIVDTDKKIYKANEEGTLIVSFSVGKLVGRQTKFVYVSTDDGRDEEILLEYLISKVLDIRPKYLTWNTSLVKLEPKFVLLENLTKNEIVINKVESKNAKFEFSIIEVTKNKAWHLKIKPLSADKGRSVVNIEIEEPETKIKMTYIMTIEIL